MKSYGIFLKKGGVGKTSICGNISYLLSTNNKKTVILDCDPQASLTTWLVEKGDFEDKIVGDIADVLMLNAKLEDCLIEIRKNLYILPCFSIGGSLGLFAENSLASKPYIFRKLREAIEGLGFDYMLCDLSPGFSTLEREVLSSVDEIITPLTPEIFSENGIEQTVSHLNEVNSNLSNISLKPIKYNKVILNNINKSFSLHRKIKRELENFADDADFKIFEVGQNRKIADCVAEGKFVFEIDKDKSRLNQFEKIIKIL